VPHTLQLESLEKTKQRIERSRPQPARSRSFQGTSNPIRHLQRTLGNQWVAELIKTGRLTPEGKITWLQPKLTVGAADDLLSNSCQCCAQKWQSLGKKDESDKGMRSSCRHLEYDQFPEQHLYIIAQRV